MEQGQYEGGNGEGAVQFEPACAQFLTETIGGVERGEAQHAEGAEVKGEQRAGKQPMQEGKP